MVPCLSGIFWKSSGIQGKQGLWGRALAPRLAELGTHLSRPPLSTALSTLPTRFREKCSFYIESVSVTSA